MPNTPQTPAKADFYPAPDAWRLVRKTIGAASDQHLADAIGVARSTITRARLEIGDTAVGGDLVAQTCHAFRDHADIAHPFDFLFRVRRGRE